MDINKKSNELSDESLDQVMGGMANPLYSEFKENPDGTYSRIDDPSGKKYTGEEAWDSFNRLGKDGAGIQKI